MNAADRADGVGAVASSLCAAHCAVSAFLPAAFGALGLGFVVGHQAEWVFTVVAIAFASVALVVAWRRRRDRHVAALLALGIAGLFLSRVVEGSSAHADDHHQAVHESDSHGEEHDDPWHLLGTAIGVFAGLMLVGGHVLNLRAQQRHPMASGTMRHQSSTCMERSSSSCSL